jgi:type IV pilus assembly protein PilA
MNKRNHSTKGFTLVEIMIVVVIIGLLAAMAIPAFQKVRRSSTKATMVNDARQISAAAQQYFMENATSQAATSSIIDATATGSNSKYLKGLSKGVVLTGPTTSFGQTDTFVLSHPNFGTITFDVDSGKSTSEAQN